MVEIDILEIPASRKQHHYYLHYTDPSWYNSHGSAWDHEASFGGHKDDDVDRSADFHTYAVEWDESNLSFYFDDKKFASYNRPTEIKQLTAQYIIVNLAIGGWAGDDIEITSDKPAYFEADWVRVWQAKPPKPDTVKIFSMNFGTCVQPNDEGKVVLGDCGNDAARAVLTPLTSTTYRINFGEVVLEIPNEKTDAGLDVGLYKWNGGNHQKVVMEKQTGYEGTVVRMKMQHSNMYLRATTDGERVVQSWADDWEWNQVWRILPQETAVDVSTDKETAPKESTAKDSTAKEAKKDSSVADSGNTAVTSLGKITSVYGSAVRYASGLLSVEVGSAFKKGAAVRILDLQGREVMRKRVAHSARMNVKPLAPGIYHVVVSDGKRLDAKMFKK